MSEEMQRTAPLPGMHYSIVAQTVDEVREIRNSPAVSMGPYLVKTGQEKLQTSVISIYTERGSSREQVRLLYMNDIALKIWQAMGYPAASLGKLHRPPRTSVLFFGVPYSD